MNTFIFKDSSCFSLQQELELVPVAVEVSESTAACSGRDGSETFIFAGSVRSHLANVRHELELLIFLHKWLC